jgi:hypothetical protein
MKPIFILQKVGHCHSTVRQPYQVLFLFPIVFSIHDFTPQSQRQNINTVLSFVSEKKAQNSPVSVGEEFV